MKRLGLTRVVMLSLIEIMAILSRFVGVGAYHGLIYDEYYYVPAARVLLHKPSPVLIHHAVPGIDPNLLSAPPFGKEMIALSMVLFGNHPWAWRLPGVVLGSLMPIVVYGLTKRLFRSEAMAFVAAALTAVDGLLIAISRVALLDSISVPFVVINMALLWRIVESLRCAQPVSRRFLLIWGVSLGLGLSAKWTGGQTILASWLILALNGKLLRVYGRRLWQILASVSIIPLVTYFLTYFYAFPSGFHKTYLAHNIVMAWAQLQWRIFKGMWSLTFYHPWSSDARSWLFLPRPAAFLIVTTSHTMIRVMAFSDPLIIWLGALTILGGALMTWRHRMGTNPWIYLLVWFIAFYGTWLLTPRSKFDYYMAPMMPAFTIAVSYILGWLWNHRGRFRVASASLAGILFVSIGYLFPMWVGMPTPRGFYHHLFWSSTWNAKPKPLSKSGATPKTTYPKGFQSVSGISVAPIARHGGDAATLPSSWTQYQNGRNHNTIYKASVSLLGQAINLGGAIVDQPAVTPKGIVYVGTNGNRLAAINWNHKAIQWSVTVPNQIMTTPVYRGSQVIIGLGNRTFRRLSRRNGWVRGQGTNGLMAFNRYTGKRLWFYPTQGEAMATPAIHGNTVYDVTGSGRLIAVSLATGKLRWSIALDGFDSMSSPLIVHNMLYVATNVYHHAYPAHPSLISAVNLQTHHLTWRRSLPVKSGLSDCSLATDGKTLVAAGVPAIITQGNRSMLSEEVFGLNTRTGAVRWHASFAKGPMALDQEEVGNPTIVGSTVYIGQPATGMVTALSLTQGHVLWSTHTGPVVAPPVVTGRGIWVQTLSGKLVWINRRTGGIFDRQQLSWGGFGPAGMLLINHALLIASKQGWLVNLPIR